MIRRILAILLLGPLCGVAQQTNPGSHTHRLETLIQLAADTQAAHWRTSVVDGVVIGGHACPSLSPSGAMALHGPDYGVIWSTAALTDQPIIRDQLPAARNFKLKQLDPSPGFFQGAPLGDYFLPAENRFATDHPQVAPADLASAMQDLGNILLFAPNDTGLRGRLSLAAERLLAWQHEDGHWDAAYDRSSQRARAVTSADFRPTFSGLLAASRVLGDAKYLDAARRGADWFLRQASASYTSAYAAQALLDLSIVTGEPKYRAAAVAAAKGWTTNVPPNVAGLLLRLHESTGENRFLDAARASMTGSDTATPPCPQHWTQIGSILDYLLAEARFRSGGKIEFPRGLAGAEGNAGPYGFAPGTIYGEPAFLKLPPSLVTTESSNLEYLSALSIRNSRLFVIVLNNSSKDLAAKIKLDPARLIPGKTVRWMQGRPLAGGAAPLDPYGNWQVSLVPYGLAVIQLTYQ